jgi:hypothetical protein
MYTKIKIDYCQIRRRLQYIEASFPLEEQKTDQTEVHSNGGVKDERPRLFGKKKI